MFLDFEAQIANPFARVRIHHSPTTSHEQPSNSNVEVILESAVTQSQYPNGYSSLAAFIASDRELSVYRKFRRISSRNLLYLQSELRILENELDRLDQEDLNSDTGSIRHLGSQCFAELSKADDAGSKERRELIQNIRKLTKEYRSKMTPLHLFIANSIR